MRRRSAWIIFSISCNTYLSPSFSKTSARYAVRRASRLRSYGGCGLPRAGASGSRGRACGEPRAFSRTRELPLAPCAGASHSENRGEAAPARDGLRIIRKSGARRVRAHRMDVTDGAPYKHEKGARAVKRALPSACVYTRLAKRLARDLSVSCRFRFTYTQSQQKFTHNDITSGVALLLISLYCFCCCGACVSVVLCVTEILNSRKIVIWQCGAVNKKQRRICGAG